MNVIKQDTFDYTENLKTIKPDYIVHGDDWKEGVKRYNRESFKTMQEWNGQVIDIPYKSSKLNFTSTSLLDIKFKVFDMNLF